MFSQPSTTLLGSNNEATAIRVGKLGDAEEGDGLLDILPSNIYVGMCRRGCPSERTAFPSMTLGGGAMEESAAIRRPYEGRTAFRRALKQERGRRSAAAAGEGQEH